MARSSPSFSVTEQSGDPSQEILTHLIRLFCLVLLTLPVFAQEKVRYELRFPNAIHHEAEIKATFSGVNHPVLNVVMSRSSPGRYALHEFIKNVYHFRATDGQGRPLRVVRPNPYQWNVSEHNGTVTVEYTLYGDLADGTYDGIDETHAHLNMPATLVWAQGFEKAPVSIQFRIPNGSNWRVATQLIPQDDGSWSAPNLDRLMDSPAEIGPHALPEWTIGDERFRLSLHHRGTDEEAAAYARMCKAVVLEEAGVFSALPRYDDGVYTFLVDYLPYASGDGMEHRDSTVITSNRDLSDSASQLIDTVSHEFFHSWNVKRIRPKSLQPFDFERANMSGELWFAEGFTSYYGPLVLKRVGFTSLDRFIGSMGAAVNAVLNDPGRQVFNVIDMSRQAPFVDAATANDPENYANTFISYYTYGEALALGIDLSIREQFPGKTLDDWMRTMWREHPDIDKPYTLDDLQSTLAETTGSKAFADEIFRRHIYGMEPMDYVALLAPAGLLLRKMHPGSVWLGVRSLDFSKGSAEITGATLRDSPLYKAGLDRGDRLLKSDGTALNSEGALNSWLTAHKPGDRVHVDVLTRAGRKDVTLTFTENPMLEIATYERAGQTIAPAMISFRNAWLASKSIAPLPDVKKYCHQCKRVLAFEYEHCPFDGCPLYITPAPASPGRLQP
jgi:predicted metalloprotease with PDZ domain